VKIPGAIIAGTNSGCGKTTVSAGLMAALVNRGVIVQPYKVGPDYIDPMFHSFVTGRYSRNLDSWLLDESTVVHLYRKNAAGCDVALIEGVMGLYDGFGGNSLAGSTAHISRILHCPVILVMNAEGMSLSAAAMLKGFMDFKGGADIRGVILNRVDSRGLYLMMKEIIEDNTGVHVLGYLPASDGYTLPERHLGLVPGGELSGLKDKLGRLAASIEKTVDLELLLKIAQDAGESGQAGLDIRLEKPQGKARIAVAFDHAFNFYYRDNLELLEMLGAELVYFSPLEDGRLPEGIDGVYFGGGYPEVFARELSENLSMREDVRSKLSKGLPAYAECGGLMYLCRDLKDMHGNSYEMAGVLPAHSEMTPSLQRFGYVNVNVLEDCILGESGFTTRAHGFHYSVVKTDGGQEQPDISYCYEVLKQKGSGETSRWKDGLKLGHTLAGYSHIHFWSNPQLAVKFVENCMKNREGECGYER